jgi:hypothetical protein
MRSKAPAKHLESFHTDKAVQDNIVESWLCVDCGVNTAPGVPSGPETRLAFALGDEEVDYTFDDQTEVYHVRDKIWEAAGMRPWSGCLCVSCLEQRIGRQLRPKDFARHDARAWADKPCTDRLLDRRGLAKITAMTDEGEREMTVPKQFAEMIASVLAPGEPWLEAAESSMEAV